MIQSPSKYACSRSYFFPHSLWRVEWREDHPTINLVDKLAVSVFSFESNHFLLIPLFKLSEDDTVRITDVGVSKPAMNITGTLTGTPAYIAPEVFRSEMYEFSADIYSLGIMMWEMWFGELAFTKIAEPTLEGFFAIVCDGYRPEPVKNCRRPPHPWDNLMQKCWRPNPDERPTAKECNEVIASLVNTVANQSMCR